PRLHVHKPNRPTTSRQNPPAVGADAQTAPPLLESADLLAGRDVVEPQGEVGLRLLHEDPPAVRQKPGRMYVPGEPFQLLDLLAGLHIPHASAEIWRAPTEGDEVSAVGRNDQPRYGPSLSDEPLHHLLRL